MVVGRDEVELISCLFNTSSISSHTSTMEESRVSWINKINRRQATASTYPYRGGPVSVHTSGPNEYRCTTGAALLRPRRQAAPPNVSILVSMPIGFLASGGQCPAFDPRILLQAGDIETNPGPTCDTCNQKLSSNMTPRECRNAQCDKRCHLQKKCSGVSGNEPWYCTEHCGEAPVNTCDECGKKMTSRMLKSARRCAVKDCPKLCHRKQKCSRIGRYDINKVWKCPAHSGRRRRSQGPSKDDQPTETVPCANRSCKH